MYRKITLKNDVIVLSVPFVHHTELQHILIAPRRHGIPRKAEVVLLDIHPASKNTLLTFRDKCV